jgi:glycerol-3-phosphate dehydrogenase
MAEDTVDAAIDAFGLTPRAIAHPNIAGTEHELIHDTTTLDGSCQTHRVKLLGTHGYSKTLFINLIQHYGLETDVARHLVESYGDRAWCVAALCADTGERFPKRGVRLSKLYPFVDGEVRYAVREEYAQTAVDVLARRTRLAFLNATASEEALPGVIELMAGELGWGKKRREKEARDGRVFLESMGLETRKGEAKQKGDEVGSRSKEELNRGENPTIGTGSPANK